MASQRPPDTQPVVPSPTFRGKTDEKIPPTDCEGHQRATMSPGCPSISSTDEIGRCSSGVHVNTEQKRKQDGWSKWDCSVRPRHDGPGIQSEENYAASYGLNYTPKTIHLSVLGNGDVGESDAIGENDRGRTQFRAKSIIPARRRILTPAAIRRRTGESTLALPSLHVLPFLTTDAPPTPPTPFEDTRVVPRVGLFEPTPISLVSTSVSEILESTKSPYSLSPSSQSSSLRSLSFKTPHRCNSFEDDAHHESSSIISRDSSITSTKMYKDHFDILQVLPSLQLLSDMPNTELFKNHRDTFALVDLRGQTLKPGRSTSSLYSQDILWALPSPFFVRLALFLDYQSYLAVRLTCRSWSSEITSARPLTLPKAHYIPVELIQEIYSYMSPTDFNAARQSCQAWMRASLNSRLLEDMLRRGGWWTGINESVVTTPGFGRQMEGRLSIWSMSKRLALECALCPIPKWAYNSHRQAVTPRGSDFAQLDGTMEQQPSYRVTRSPFDLILETDFSELSDACAQAGSQDEYDPAGKVAFTPSVCGKFVLVMDGCRIYLYQLGQKCTGLPLPAEGSESNSSGFPSDGSRLPGTGCPLFPLSRSLGGTASISPVTTIVCPRRVISVSMDTSAGRYAIAALLEDRMGLFCDLILYGQSDSEGIPLHGNAILEDERHTGGLCNTFGNISSSDLPRTFELDGKYHGIPSYSFPRHLHQSLPQPSPSIPLKVGRRRIYSLICSTDEEPLSVSICPQRHCVAFGFPSGIELHWNDLVSGQDANRSFPLSSPSDFLYFLPPRRMIDDPRKLRLVSSSTVAGLEIAPKSNLNVDRENGAYATCNCERSDLRRLCGRQVPRGVRSRERADLFQAVPLSDGVHVLAIDPESCLLCLGTDAPRYSDTRLKTRFLFRGPEALLPDTYAVGSDLQHGVRIAAGYGDQLWLFSVPGNVFMCESEGFGEVWTPTYCHRKSHCPNNSVHGFCDWNTGWPMTIYGVHIADVPRLSKLSVDSRLQSFTIWAFAEDGIARAWQLRDDRKEHHLVRNVVARCGAVLERPDGSHGSYNKGKGKASGFEPNSDIYMDHLAAAFRTSAADEDGDIVMNDAPPLPGRSTRDDQFTYDGASSEGSTSTWECRVGQHAPPPPSVRISFQRLEPSAFAPSWTINAASSSYLAKLFADDKRAADWYLKMGPDAGIHPGAYARDDFAPFAIRPLKAEPWRDEVVRRRRTEEREQRRADDGHWWVRCRAVGASWEEEECRADGRDGGRTEAECAAEAMKGSGERGGNGFA